MKDLKKNKMMAVCGAAAAIIIITAALVVSQTNFLGSLVLDQLNKAVKKELNVELTISPLDGNPISGFKGKDMILSRSGDTLLKVGEVGIKLSLPSLLINSPRVSLITLSGLSSDYDSLNSLVPKSQSQSGPKDIPIDKVEISESEISSKWGALELTNGYVILKNSENFKVNLQGKIKGESFSARGIAAKESGSWTLGNFTAKINDSEIIAEGSLYPSLDVTVETKALDLHKTASLIPNINTYGVSGFFTGKSTLRISGKDISAKGEGELKEALVEGIPLSSISAKWNCDKGLMEVEVSDSKIFGSSIKGRLLFDARNKEKKMELKASVKELTFSDWTENFSEKMPKDALAFKGRISSLEADLKGPLDALVGKIEIAPSTIAYKNFSFKEIKGSAEFDGTPKGKVNFTALHNGKKISLEGDFSVAEGVASNLKLDAENISMNDLSASAPALSKYGMDGSISVKGALSGVTGSWAAEGTVTTPSLSVKNIGSLKNMRLVSSYKLKEGKATLKEFTSELNGAKLSASGTAEPSGSLMALKISGTAKRADLTQFYSLVPFFKTMGIKGTAEGTWSVSGSSSAPEVKAKVKASGGEFKNLRISSFSSDISFASSKLLLERMNVAAAGGTASLKCFADLRKNAPAVKWNLIGKVKDVNLDAVNNVLNMKEDIGGTCTGDIRVYNDGSGIKWEASVADSEPRWKDIRIESLTGKASGTDKVVNLDGVRIKFLKGDSVVRGNVQLAPAGKPAKEAKLNLVVNADKINVYEAIRKYTPSVRGIQGHVQGEIKVTGTAGDPIFEGNGTLAPFRYRGFMLPIVAVDFKGNMKEIDIPNAEAKLQGGTVTGKARIYLKDGEWHVDLKTTGRNMEMKQFGAYLPEKFRTGLGGRADFDLKGGGKISNFGGRGTFSSSYLRVMGIHFKNVKAPFYVSDGYAVMEDVKAEMNGGTLKGGLAMDIAKSIWGGNLTAEGIDIDQSIKQAFPSLKGSVTGKGDLKIRGGGETGRTSTVKAAGIMLMHDGEIKSFDAVEAAKKYTGGKPLRFASIKCTFTYDGGSITILPGSQAAAPKGDSVYRYVMLDGIITHERNISMFAMGKVNIRALNALLGALQGVINAGMDFTSSGKLNSGELLQNFLGGVLSGFAKSDFRFVTMNIGGTEDSLYFTNIKVDKNVKNSSASDAIPKSSSDPDEKDFLNDTTFRLKFEIPVGPGTQTNPDEVKGQVVEQTLENLFKNIDFGL